MKNPKLIQPPNSPSNNSRTTQPPNIANSDIRDIKNRQPVRLASITELAPLLDEIAEKSGRNFVISSEGSDLYVSKGCDPKMVNYAEDAIELQIGDRSAQLRFLGKTASPAFAALERMAMVGEVSAGIAHDINSLLVVITTGLSMAERDCSVPQNEQSRGRLLTAFGEMKAASQNISAICRRIQAFASLKDEIQVLNLNRIVEDSLAMVKNISVRGGGTGPMLSFENKVDYGVWCKAIPAELQSCIINIINNAIRHGFKDRQSGTVTVEANKSEGTIRLDISNDGAPIPPEVQEDLFRHPLRTSCDYGLGLYTAARRLDTFGAHMTFVSAPDKTTFTIFLQDAGY